MIEYNLDIMDIEWEFGNKYESNRGAVYVVKDLELINEENGDDICQEYDLAYLVKLKFKKVIDWSKVPVDAKILVRNNLDSVWAKRHFARYEYGKVYAFAEGSTSWSNYGKQCDWNYAKLAEEVEE